MAIELGVNGVPSHRTRRKTQEVETTGNNDTRNRSSSARSFRIIRRQNVGTLAAILSTVAAAMLSVLATSVLILMSGSDVSIALSSLVQGSLSDLENIAGSLNKSAPVLLAGLSAAVAFRGRVWNVGQEGQVFAGAMMAFWLNSSLSTSGPTAVVVTILGGLIGGGALGAICGILKTKFGVHEIVSTVMGNYLVIILLSYLLASRLWMDPSQYYMQTPQIDVNQRLPILISSGDLHLGVVIAVLGAIIVQVLLSTTVFGYRLRAFGSNAEAARFRGIDPRRMFVIGLLISGALAGLGGAMQTYGTDFRLTTTSLQGIGTTGIVVGVVAGMRPFAVVAVGLLFGCLAQGALLMEVVAGVSSAIVPAIQAIFFITFLCCTAISKYRIVRTIRHA